MSRMVGTVSRGVRAPIIRSGDDLVEIVTKSVLEAAAQPEDGFAIRDRDVVAMTEAIVARAQGNYASVDDIAADVKEKLGGETVGVIFPILSRNRFAVCLRGIAKGAKKIVLMLSYPSDEVGNHLIDPDVMDEKGVDPYRDVLTLEKYRELFGYTVHPFTGVDYVAYYMDLIRDCGAEAEVIFANDAKAILPYTKNVINCDIHTRKRTKRRLIAAGAEKVFSLDEILTAPVNGSGYNENYGLLGTNKATEDTVKLFPRDCQSMVEAIQKKLYDATGKHVEVMVYGDGAFKDPVGKIWELADPVVSPAYTSGLEGTPNELKLKYLADNDFAGLNGEELREAIQKKLYDATGKHVEVMVYGDGAFKDPVGKIWELADPVVSPAYTAGLEGTPNELKLKYLADNDFAGLDGEELRQAIKGRIAAKDGSSLVGNMVSEGTTPRRLTDLIGSLCDLTSGSGDKGTPIVYIQGYFDNYTND